jgi:hypothetical protein
MVEEAWGVQQREPGDCHVSPGQRWGKMLESGRNAGGASGFKLPHKYPDTHTQQMIYNNI